MFLKELSNDFQLEDFSKVFYASGVFYQWKFSQKLPIHGKYFLSPIYKKQLYIFLLFFHYYINAASREHFTSNDATFLFYVLNMSAILRNSKRMSRSLTYRPSNQVYIYVCLYTHSFIYLSGHWMSNSYKWLSMNKSLCWFFCL